MTVRSRFVVGIDLGTTTTAVAYVDTARGRKVRSFAVPQLIGAGEVGEAPVLPSFCYLPAGDEVPPGALDLPWEAGRSYAVGVFARDQGAAVPGRMVGSAKSWLAHSGVDRTAGILPWGGELGAASVSPVEVSRRFLEHLRRAWDHNFGDELDEDGNPCLLADQQVVLTVPASFDETARRLTIEAARGAGLEQLTLLEEPLAAFYEWLRQHEDRWQEELREGETVLVVDVGGGTTDFSLVAIEPGYTLRRTAAGEHLLLGGDNIDMALAREAEESWGGRLDPRQWSQLCQRCRQAKERLLSAARGEEEVLTVAAAGRSVVASTRSFLLRRERVEEIIGDGFFPLLPADAPGPRKRSGMREMGLPYVSDPAVTRHLLAFLRQGGGEGAPRIRPDRVLFNGGSMAPPSVRRRIASVLGSWGGGEDPLPELASSDLVLAVSRGAAYHGLARRGEGVRVRGGMARAYFLEVGAAATPPPLLCVMPRDTDEDIPVELPGTFCLAANRPVRFPLWSSATRLGDRPGDQVVERDELSPLPALETVLPYGRGGAREVEVGLGAVLNEVGTLELWCETREGHHRYPLTFDLRATVGRREVATPEVAVTAARLEAAAAMLRTGFGGGDPRDLPGIAGALEDALDLRRGKWGLSLLRRLGDVLLQSAAGRLATPEHEARWLNLCGFCLRPGFGAPGDEHRVRQLWRLWHRGPQRASKPQVTSEWWICWRRVAGGLRSGQQQAAAAPSVKELLGRRGDARLGRRGDAVLGERWRFVGALERLDPGVKERLLRGLVKAEGALTDAHLWTVARLGARRLLHGPANAVLPAAALEPLLPSLFARLAAARSVPERRAAALAAVSLCRLTGVRGLDVADPLRRSAESLAADLGVEGGWLRGLHEVSEPGADFDADLAGDPLPLGLTLADGDRAD